MEPMLNYLHMSNLANFTLKISGLGNYPHSELVFYVRAQTQTFLDLESV